jgi:hypothetical protein
MAYEGMKKLKERGMSGALGSWIGRRKYGKKRFQEAAAEGKKMRGMKPKHTVYKSIHE